MKRTFTSFLFIVLSFTFCKAQYVTLPDANFVAWLNANGFSAALNGSQLDTTSPQVTNATIVDCHSASITDLTGIQYFTGLTVLVCGDNYLTFLPPIKSNLVNLRCYSNLLTGLPALPQSISYIDCSQNQITSLPSFSGYSNLDTIICRVNQITSVPALSPSSLSYFDCDANPGLASLPDLPSLLYFDCSLCALGSLPDLPAGLTFFDCDGNQLTTLPDMSGLVNLNAFTCVGNQLTSIANVPPNLTNWDCSFNRLSALPTLPNSLQYFECDDNPLTQFPTPPTGLIELNCSNTQLGGMPSFESCGSLNHVDIHNSQLYVLPLLPSGVDYLDCGTNQISTLANGSFPNGLSTLFCNNNFLTFLPNLTNINVLDCSHNSIGFLPPLPKLMDDLVCNHNQLTTIPPVGLSYLDCSSNLITSLPDFTLPLFTCLLDSNPGLLCMPFLPQYSGNSEYTFSVAGTGITCFPNVIKHTGYFAPIDTMPVCDVFNKNGCQVSWNIKGQAVKDGDGSCSTTNDGTPLQNISVKLYDGNHSLLEQEYVNGAGNYSFDTHLGIYSVQADLAGLPFTLLCPAGDIHTDTLTVSDSLDYNANFRFNCNAGYDLGVNAIGGYQPFFPNDEVTVPIFAGDESTYYGFACNTSGVSGTITATISGPASISSATSSVNATSSVSGNTATWTIADFSQVDFKSAFLLVLHTNTLAQAGQEVCVSVRVSATGVDNNPANDTLTQCYTVVNSHDPNDKEVNPAGTIAQGYDGYLTYTIHFQNTGTAAAQNIQILDTISNNLDISTFQLVAFSQVPTTQVFAVNHLVKFSYPNINLADSTADKANSVGYVQYKIKPISNIAAGNSINNTAYIYFDFNSPIITNTATNSVEVATAVKNMDGGSEVNVYPNPASGLLVVSCKLLGSQLEIMDVLGRKLLTQSITGNETTIDVSHLTAGVYFVRLQTDGGEAVRKFVKQ